MRTGIVVPGSAALHPSHQVSASFHSGEVGSTRTPQREWRRTHNKGKKVWDRALGQDFRGTVVRKGRYCGGAKVLNSDFRWGLSTKGCLQACKGLATCRFFVSVPKNAPGPSGKDCLLYPSCRRGPIYKCVGCHAVAYSISPRQRNRGRSTPQASVSTSSPIAPAQKTTVPNPRAKAVTGPWQTKKQHKKQHSRPSPSPATGDPWGHMDTKFGRISMCQMLHNICIDENEFIQFGIQPTHRQWHWKRLYRDGQKMGSFDVPGWGDDWIDGQRRFETLEIRPNSTADPSFLHNPTFRKDMVPFIWSPSDPFNFAHAFVGSVCPIAHALHYNEAGLLQYSKKLALVPYIDDFSLPLWFKQLLHPFTSFPVQSLATLSRRPTSPKARPACFKEVLLCELPACTSGFANAAKHIRLKYRHLPGLSAKWQPNFRRLRILFVKRSRMRKIVNQGKLVKLVRRWKHTQDCMTLSFGHITFEVALKQLAVTDVLVGMFGSGLAYALFMHQYTSVVEVHPYGWYSWKHRHGFENLPQYYHQMFKADNRILHWGIITAEDADSRPGPDEIHVPALHRPASPRDRSTVLHWAALRSVLQEIREVGGDIEQYETLNTTDVMQRSSGHVTLVNRGYFTAEPAKQQH